MIALGLTLLFPLAGILLLGCIGHWRCAGGVNLVISIITFAAALFLAINIFKHGPILSTGKLFYIDAFNVYLIVLNAFVGMTTAVFSGPYMAHELKIGRVDDGRMRLYYSMYQGFLFTMLIALSTNNLGVLWVSIEGATLATVLLVSLYRTRESIEAGWKYFIICGVGISQALFGTILVYFAAAKVLPGKNEGLLWTALQEHASQMDSGVMALAFVFLLVGYGTKVGLVPLHNWLPDAHSEGPTPMSAILSGLLLNIALYAIVRFKMLLGFGQKETSRAADVEQPPAGRKARRQVAQQPQLAPGVRAARGLLPHVVGKHGVVAPGVVTLAVQGLEIDGRRILRDEHGAAVGARHDVVPALAEQRRGGAAFAHRARTVQAHAGNAATASASARTTRSWSAWLRSALIGRLSTCSAARLDTGQQSGPHRWA